MREIQEKKIFIQVNSNAAMCGAGKGNVSRPTANAWFKVCLYLVSLSYLL